MDISGSERFPVLGYFEEGVIPWCSIKGGRFLVQLGCNELLNYALNRAACLSEGTKYLYLTLLYYAEVPSVPFCPDMYFSAPKFPTVLVSYMS